MFNNILKIEENAFDRVALILTEISVRGKIGLISDNNVMKLYGEKILSQLKQLGNVEVIIVDQNSVESSFNLGKKFILEGFDFIVGLGGGKVLDVGKFSSYIAKKFYISLPTTLANDGIASPVSVLNDEGKRHRSLGSKMPDVIIIDTKVMGNSPKELLKAGIGDTISNYTALMDWKLAVSKGKETMNDFAWLMSQNSLNALLETRYDELNDKFIRVLCDSLVISGLAMSFAGTSRPVSGSEHLFSHALDRYGKKNNIHGLQVALGTITILKLIDEDYSTLLEYLKRFEVNINPVKLGIDFEDFSKALLKAKEMRPDRYTVLNELVIEEMDLQKIYKELVEEL